MRLTHSDYVTIGVGLIGVAFSYWFAVPFGALTCFVVGGLVLIVNHLRQDGLSSDTDSNLELNRVDDTEERPVVPARGPFPPFPLGGSVEKKDVFDYIGTYQTDQWHPVHGALDVEIDWTQFRRAQLVAELTIRGHNCRVGILDIENNHVFVASDALSAPQPNLNWEHLSDIPQSDELLHHQFRIPPQVGVKRYRLVVQRGPGPGSGTFWVRGVIAFRSIPLADSRTEWFTPVEDGPLRGRPPGALEAVLDWSIVRDPINTVIAEIVVTVFCTITGDRGTGRAILRDLEDDSTIETEWVEASGRRMHGAWPVSLTRKAALPKKAGIRRYVLEVEVSKVGMRATATGVLRLGH